MKLDLSIPYDLSKFKSCSDKLVKEQKKVELRALKQVRSIKHNSYLHVCITLYAIYFGSTLNEAKTDLKRECDFMVYVKDNRKYLKETSKMDSKELSEFIEWIRNYSSLNGCYIPTSEEYLTNKFNIDREIDNHKKYL